MKIIKNLTVKGSANREMLTDIYFQDNGKPKPIIIFVHGFKGFKDWGCWDLVAQKFAENNYIFVKFNLSHNGTTVQNPLEFDDLEAFGNNNFSKELFDIDKLLEAILNNTLSVPSEEIDRDEIYLIGHSRGAGTCIIKAKDDKRIKKMVLWAAQTNFDSYFKENLDEWEKEGVRYILNGRTFQQMPLYWQFAEDFFSNKENYSPNKLVEKLSIPLCFIYGKEDNVVKPLVFSNLGLKNTSINCIFIEKANHVFNGEHPFSESRLPLEMKKLVDFTLKFLEK